MLNRFSCVQFFATLWTLAPPPHGILQTRTLEWVAVLPPGDLPDPGIQLLRLGVSKREGTGRVNEVSRLTFYADLKIKKT